MPSGVSLFSIMLYVHNSCVFMKWPFV